MMMKNRPIMAALAATALFCSSPVLQAEEPVATQLTLEKVSLNLASAEQMADRLYGVGLTKAQAIVSYRKLHGRFTSLNQLVQVKGIGPAILERNKELLTL